MELCEHLCLDVLRIVFQFHEIEPEDVISNPQWLLALQKLWAPFLQNESEMIQLATYAASVGDLNLTDFLYKPLIYKQVYGRTFLRHASRHGELKVIQLILPYLHVDDIHVGNNYAFKIACSKGYSKIVELLLPFLTADDIRSDNNTFHTACFGGRWQIVQLLLPHLTVENIRSGNNFAFRYACKHGHFEVVDLLLPHLNVEDIRAQDNYALRHACKHGRLAVVQLLLRFLTVDDIRALYNYAFQRACTNDHLAEQIFVSKTATLLCNMIPQHLDDASLQCAIEKDNLAIALITLFKQ